MGLPLNIYSKEELAEMLPKMREASNQFYVEAVKIGCHPFIEFTGMINEYIQMCEVSLKQDVDFASANKHSGVSLVAREHHIKYLAEKFDCVFGPVLSEERNKDIFFKEMRWDTHRGNLGGD